MTWLARHAKRIYSRIPHTQMVRPPKSEDGAGRATAPFASVSGHFSSAACATTARCPRVAGATGYGLEVAPRERSITFVLQRAPRDERYQVDCFKIRLFVPKGNHDIRARTAHSSYHRPPEIPTVPQSTTPGEGRAEIAKKHSRVKEMRTVTQADSGDAGRTMPRHHQPLGGEQRRRYRMRLRARPARSPPTLPQPLDNEWRHNATASNWSQRMSRRRVRSQTRSTARRRPSRIMRSRSSTCASDSRHRRRRWSSCVWMCSDCQWGSARDGDIAGCAAPYARRLRQGSRPACVAGESVCHVRPVLRYWSRRPPRLWKRR